MRVQASPMNDSKPIHASKYYSAPLIERLITERTPIHTFTYSKAIRAQKPYICFIYIDIDSLPTIINIPLKRPDRYALVIDDAVQQPELHVPYRGDEKQNFDGEKSKIQALTLDTQASSVEVIIPIAEQHVSLDVTLNPEDRREIPVHSLILDAQSGSVEVTIPIEEQRVPLDATFNPMDQREIPVVQFRALDAQVSSVEKTISCTTLRPSQAVTFNAIDHQERLALQSLKQDFRAGTVEETNSLVEQKASLDAVLYLAKKHEEISIAPYILDNKPAQCTNATTREKQQYDSYNQSLAIIEPRRYDYPVSKTRTRSIIVRYHRYSRISHIASSN